MGYTHYFHFNRLGHDVIETEKLFKLAVKKCNLIAQYYNKRWPSKHPNRLSGYTAYTNKYNGIKLNGSGENAHEDFCLRESFYLNTEVNFCKTARKPYDIVVVACLTVLKHYLKDMITISSDGNNDELLEGYELAKQTLGLKRIKPLRVR